MSSLKWLLSIDVLYLLYEKLKLLNFDKYIIIGQQIFQKLQPNILITVYGTAQV